MMMILWVLCFRKMASSNVRGEVHKTHSFRSVEWCVWEWGKKWCDSLDVIERWRVLVWSMICAYTCDSVQLFFHSDRGCWSVWVRSWWGFHKIWYLLLPWGNGGPLEKTNCMSIKKTYVCVDWYQSGWTWLLCDGVAMDRVVGRFFGFFWKSPSRRLSGFLYIYTSIDSEWHMIWELMVWGSQRGVSGSMVYWSSSRALNPLYFLPI